MASGIQLVAQNTDAINRGIQDVITNLKSLESQIAKNAKQVSLMDQVFGNQQGMKDFIGLLGSVKGSQFTGFASAMRQLVEAGKLASSGNLPNAAAQITVFTTSLTNASNNTNIAAFNTLVTQISTAFTNLSKLSIPKTAIDSMESIRSFINTYIQISKTTFDFSKLDEILFGKGTTTGIIPGIKRIFEEINKFPPDSKELTKRVSASINSISEIIRAYLAISESLSKAGGGIGSNLQQIATTIRDLFTAIFDPKTGIGSFKVSEDNSGVIKSVKSVIGIVNSISKVTASAATFDATALATLGTNVSVFITSIANAFSGKNTESLKKLTGAGDAIKSISSLLNSLSKIGKVNIDLADIKKLVTVFTQLAAAFKVSAFALKFVPGGKALKDLAISLDHIGSAFRAFKDLTGVEIDLETVKRLGKTLLALISSVRIVSTFSGKPEKIRAVADLLNAIANIFKNVINVDVSVPQLIAFELKMRAFRGALKEIGNIANDVPNIGNSLSQNLSKSSTDLKRAGTIFQSGFLNAITFGFAERIGQTLFDSFSTGINDFLTGQSFKNLGDTLKGAGQSLISGFGLNNLTGSKGFDLATQFDDLSNQFGIFAESIPLKEAQEFANVIGIKYPLSANEALKATLDLAKAGQNFASIKNILPTAADLSSLSESKDINKATQFLIAAKGSFAEFADGVKASFDPKNIAVAANAVFAAANVSTASVDSMTEALSKVGPAAAKMNLDLKTSAAIISQFEDSNIRGAEAGTLLRTVLAGFQTDKARDELKRLGVALINSDGTFRNIGTEVIPELVSQYQNLGLTQVQVADSIKQFGDVYAQQGISILVSKNATKGILAEMAKVPDVASAAQKSFESFKGIIEQIRGSFETLLVKGIGPLITRFFNPIARLGLKVINFFLSLDQSIIDVAANAVLLVAGFATLTGTVLILVGTISQLSGSVFGLVFSFAKMLIQLPLLIIQFGAFSASAAASLALIGTLALAIVAGAALLTAAFSAVENNINGAKHSFENLQKVVGDVFGEIQRIAGTVFKGIGIIFNNLVGNGSAVKGVFDGISEAINKVLDTLKGIDTETIAKFLYTAKKAADELLESLGNLVGGFIGLFTGDAAAQDKIAKGFSGIRDIINNIFSGIDIGKLLPVGDIISSALKSIGISINDVNDIVGFIGNTISSVFTQLSGFATQLIADLSPLLQIFQQLAGFVGSVINSIALLVSQQISIQEFASGIGDAFNKLIFGIFGDIGQTISNIGVSIGSTFLQSFGAAIQNADFGKAVYFLIDGLFNTLYTAITSIPDRLIDLGITLGSGLLKGIGVAIKVGDWNKVGALIADGIKRAFENVVRLIVGLGVSILNSIFPPEQIAKTGETAANTLINSILKVMVGLIDPRTWSSIFSGLANIIYQIVYEIATLPGTILIEIGRQIQGTFIGGILQFLGNAIKIIAAPIIYLSGVFLRLASVLFSVIGSFVTFAERVLAASAPVKIALLALGAAIAQIGFGLFTNALAAIPGLIASVIPTIAALGNSFLALVPRIYAVVAPIAAIGIALLGLKSIFDNVWRLFEGNVLDFLVNTLGDFAFNILKIFGVDDESINKLRSGLQVWVSIFDYILEKIINLFRQTLARISIEVNRATNGSTVNRVEQQVNTAFDAKSAKQTFAEITKITTDALQSGDSKTLATLGDQMVANGQKVLGVWRDLISSEEFKTLSDDEFKNAFSAVFSAGQGREAIRSLKGDTGDLLRIFTLLNDSKNPKAVDAIKESYGELETQLDQATLTTDQQRQALQLLNQLVDGGKISTDAYNQTINKVFGDMASGTTVINDQGEAVGNLRKNWEDADEAIKKVSDTIGTTVDKQATLISSFADNERKQSEKLQSLYKKLFDAVDFGDIGQEDADKYFDAVLQQMGLRRQSERDKINPFRAKVGFNAPAAGGATFDLEKDPDYQAFLKQLKALPPAEVPVTPTINTEGNGIPGLDIPTPDQAQQESEDVLKVKDDYKQKEDDLNKDYADKEKKLNEDIAKDAAEYLRDKQQSEADYNKESLRRQQDHDAKLLDIENKNTEQLQDAVASRDSAAAQAAVKNRGKELKAEDDQFKLDNDRRKQDFDDAQAQALAKAQLHRQEQLDELTALQQERQAKLAELYAERDAEIAKQQDLVATTKSGTEQQKAIWTQFYADAGNSLQSFANRMITGLSSLSPAVSPAINAIGTLLTGYAQSSFGSLGGIVGNFVQTAANNVVRAINAVQGPQNRPANYQATNPFITLGNAVNNAANRNGTPAPVGPQRAPTTPAPSSPFNVFGHREGGGPFLPFKPVEISERGKPELIRTQDGKYYLSPGNQGGYVLPPKPGGRQMGGGMSFNMQNDIHINGIDMSADEIGNILENRIVTKVAVLIKNINEGS